MGVMVAKQDKRFTSSQSIEKCARVGMAKFTLASQALGTFRGEIEKEYKKLLSPKYSYWKMALNLTIIYPIIIMIKSIWNVVRLTILTEQLKPLQSEVQQKTHEISVQIAQKKLLDNPQLAQDLSDPKKLQEFVKQHNTEINQVVMKDPVMKQKFYDKLKLQEDIRKITNEVLGDLQPLDSSQKNQYAFV